VRSPAEHALRDSASRTVTARQPARASVTPRRPRLPLLARGQQRRGGQRYDVPWLTPGRTTAAKAPRHDAHLNTTAKHARGAAAASPRGDQKCPPGLSWSGQLLLPTSSFSACEPRLLSSHERVCLLKPPKPLKDGVDVGLACVCLDNGSGRWGRPRAPRAAAIVPKPDCVKLKIIPRTFSTADDFAAKGGVSARGDKPAHAPRPLFRGVTNLAGSDPPDSAFLGERRRSGSRSAPADGERRETIAASKG